MQIHHTEGTMQDRWVLDPITGPAKRRELVVQPSSVTAIKAPDSEVQYDIQPDGTFNVPDEVSAHFLRMPGWHAGLSPFPPREIVEEYEAQQEAAKPAGKRTAKPVA